MPLSRFGGLLGLDRPALAQGLRLALAALVAFSIASLLHVGNAYWAAMPVWVVSQSARGLLLERAAFRVLGTLVGAAAGFGLLRLGADPFAMLALLGLWVGVNAAAVQMLRGVHGYGALMAGMTAAVVVLPSVLHPDHAQALALARVECTLIGVVTVTLVTGYWTPRAPRRAFFARARALAGDAVGLSARLLRGLPAEAAAAEERGLLRDLARAQEEAALVTAGSVEGYRRLRDVDALAVAALGVMAAARAMGQPRHRGPETAALADALDSVPRIPDEAGPGSLPGAIAARPRLAEPLRALLHAEAALAGAPPAAEARSFRRKAVLLAPHADALLALEAGLVAGGATALAAMAGLASGWPPAGLSALGVCIFSMVIGTLPSARAAAPVMAKGVMAGVLAALLYRFLVQPHVGTVPELILSVLPFILVGALARVHPRTAMPALDANMCFMLASQAVLPAVTDRAVILNDSAALVLSVALVAGAASLLPPRAPRRAARAARAVAETLAGMVRTPGPEAPDRAGRRLLRLGLQIDRAFGTDPGPGASPLAALSLGEAILGLHALRARPGLEEAPRASLSAALSALGGMRADPLATAARLEGLAAGAGVAEEPLRYAAGALRDAKGLLTPPAR